MPKDTSHRLAGSPPREAITRVLTDGADDFVPVTPLAAGEKVAPQEGDAAPRAVLPRPAARGTIINLPRITDKE